MQPLQFVRERVRIRSRIREVMMPRLLRGRAMLFPTFDEELHRTILSYSDYFRYATLGLAVQTILSEEIPGSFAEVGVYRGNMAKFLHRLAPHRTYYLFDTFEGFPEQDLEPEQRGDGRFTNTSVDLVLRTIGDTHNVVVKAGYVPETFAGLESERFAFALLDVDLYAPTARSLEFLYPRMAAGGYVILHDYNSPESNRAVKRAADEFMRDKPEKLIELADASGTALFRKH